MTEQPLALPSESSPNADRVFAEPWQAQVFAITLALHERGLFTWPEWAQALGAQIAAAHAVGDPDRGDTYYHHWLSALERILVDKDASSIEELDQVRHAWEHAAERTPHGQPIELEARDFTSRI